MIEEQNDSPEPLEEDINITRTKKEIEKFQAEINKTNNDDKKSTRRWSKAPVWVAALSPIIVGLCTLYIVNKSGFLQAQEKLNTMQKIIFDQNKVIYDSIINTKTLLSKSLTIKVDSLQKLKDYIEKKLIIVQNDKKSESEKTLSLLTQLGICDIANKQLADNLKERENIINNGVLNEKQRTDSIKILKNVIDGLKIDKNLSAQSQERALSNFKSMLKECKEQNASLIKENKKLQ